MLGEIPLRKVDDAGDVILDPEGNPDTSFLAKIPADTPFTFQTLDRNGMVLNMAQTWHQVRPGEVRTNCGGSDREVQGLLGVGVAAAAIGAHFAGPDLVPGLGHIEHHAVAVQGLESE
ncbi:MAG: hypothetical protein AAFY88_15495, partial [Acidobacteriota bacterium]